jgi:hypothetical protein
MPDRCARGHLLDAANRYEERGPAGRVIVRCRRCRSAQRATQRTRSKARPAGQLAIVDLARHQHPTEADRETAAELWRTGAAGTACRQAGIGAADIARICGCNPGTARNWLTGAPIQRRYLQAATALLLALGSIHPKQPTGPTAGTGDSILLIGGHPNRDGPWHASPPHHGPTPNLAAYENWYAGGNAGPKFFDWWPCTGFVSSLTESNRLLQAHGYTPDNPRVHAHASRCHGTPRWRNDCPNCTGVGLPTAAWAIHMQDLYNGHGCTPDTCPETTPHTAGS